MLNRFNVGQRYTRATIADLIAMPLDRRKGGDWATGYSEWNGASYIFANVGNSGRTGHDYANRWEGDDLIWSGKANSARGQPRIERMISGTQPVYVFWREADREAFIYAGQGNAINVEGQRPVRVTWAFVANDASNVPASFPLINSRRRAVNIMAEHAAEAAAQTGMTTTATAKTKILAHSHEALVAVINALIDKQEGRCALTAMPLQWRGDHDDGELCASLDRINSSGGYERSNLQVVCWFANRWKGASDDGEFRRLIAMVRAQPG